MEAVRRRSCVPMHASPHLQASLTAARPAPFTADCPARAAAPAERWESSDPASPATSTQTPPACQPQPTASRRTCRVAGCTEVLPPGYCKVRLRLRPPVPTDPAAVGPPSRRRPQPVPRRPLHSPPVRRVEGTPGLCSCRTGTHPLPHPPPPKHEVPPQTYRICPTHKTAASFETGGKSCRFCQQCGSVHELAAFDPGRLSCRRSLEQHSRARALRRAAAGGGAKQQQRRRPASLKRDRSGEQDQQAARRQLERQRAVAQQVAQQAGDGAVAVLPAAGWHPTPHAAC